MARINPLILDLNLSAIANDRAKIIYETKFSHDGWKKSFKGTECIFIGENISKGYDNNPISIHDAFMNSKSHRDIILSKNYTSIGLGSYKEITVELFCGK